MKNKDYDCPLIFFMLVIYCFSPFFCPWLTCKAALSDVSAFNNPCNSESVSLQQLLLTTKVLFTHWHEHTPSPRGKEVLDFRQRRHMKKLFFFSLPRVKSREGKRAHAHALTHTHTHTSSLPSDCGVGAQLVTSGCILESVYISKTLKNYTERK